jgi:hypothetical protein
VPPRPTSTHMVFIFRRREQPRYHLGMQLKSMNTTCAVLALLLVCSARPVEAEEGANKLPDALHDVMMLSYVVDGVDLLPEPRKNLRAIISPELAAAIGLNHPGFPRPCERAIAASTVLDMLGTFQNGFAEELREGHRQTIEMARAVVPPKGLVVGRRTLTGDTAVSWVLSHPVKYSFALADRVTVEKHTVDSIDRLTNDFVKSCKAAVRACEKASK